MFTKSKSMLFPGCDFRDLGRAIAANTPAEPRSRCVVKDDRTGDEKLSHSVGVLATDPGMSGWGEARGGLSLCVWACHPDVNADTVLAWVGKRSDMENPQIIDLATWEAPEEAAHVRIYLCNPGHPATC